MPRPACLICCLLALSACAGGGGAPPADAGPSPEERWERAQAAWERREAGAFALWRSLDPATPGGATAHARLAEAEVAYRAGIEGLALGDPDFRASLERGVEIAPMDPRLYLPLARACRDRGLDDRADDYYAKLIAAIPGTLEARIAREELGDPRPELEGLFDPEPPPAPTPSPTEAPGPATSLPVALGAAVAFLGAALLLLWARRRRGVSLTRIVESSPELHPAVAYLVGSLRHELLKHRIGAVGDALAALHRGEARPDQLAFLESRLYGGEPLREAWRGHLRAFDRALGFRVDLGRDRWFQRAGRAIAAIAALEGRLQGADARSRRRLARAHRTLGELDAHLAELVGRLVRTRVDGAMLREVVEDVRSEYHPSLVELDELRVREPEEPVDVEIFRVDLMLILKNVVRNAILAVGRSAPPRRVALEVRVDLEPTGEEMVRIRVLDTSAEPLTARAIYDRRIDRGLGLVTAALSRYDGAIDVEQAGAGFEKAVSLRFFRALDDVRRGREAA